MYSSAVSTGDVVHRAGFSPNHSLRYTSPLSPPLLASPDSSDASGAAAATIARLKQQLAEARAALSPGLSRSHVQLSPSAPSPRRQTGGRQPPGQSLQRRFRQQPALVRFLVAVFSVYMLGHAVRTVAVLVGPAMAIGSVALLVGVLVLVLPEPAPSVATRLLSPVAHSPNRHTCTTCAASVKPPSLHGRGHTPQRVSPRSRAGSGAPEDRGAHALPGSAARDTHSQRRRRHQGKSPPASRRQGHSVPPAEVRRMRQELESRAGKGGGGRGLPFSDEYIASVMGQPSKSREAGRRSFQYARTKLEHVLAWREEYQPSRVKRVDVHRELQCGSLYWNGYDVHGRPVLFVRAARKNYADLNVAKQVAMHVLMLETGVQFMPPGVTQFVLCADASDLGLRSVSLSLMKALLRLMTKSYPDRLGVLCVAPVNTLVRLLFNGLKPLMPSGLKRKIVLASDATSALRGILPPAAVPDFLGGPASHEHLFPHRSGRSGGGAGGDPAVDAAATPRTPRGTGGEPVFSWSRMLEHQQSEFKALLRQDGGNLRGDRPLSPTH